MLPAYVDDVLDAGSGVLGTIWTFFAVGSFLGSLLWVKLGKKLPYSFSLGGVMLLWGLAPVSFSYVTSEWVVFAIMFLGGVVYAPYNIVSPTLQQTLVPNSLRGRVVGVYGLIAGLGFPIGVYLGGVVGELLGVSETILLSGLLTVGLGLLVMLNPVLRFKQTSVLPADNQKSM